ncbi:MAG: phosphoribosylformylglycinamidine synthase subunit PurS [Phycisphaerales bacterium]|nr:phosphoribosylformylglycinamidine synthase subunit PurS [Phycisphaerales bacterium]
MPQRAVHRFEVRPRTGQADPRGDAAQRAAADAGDDARPSRIDVANIYLIEGPLHADELARIGQHLLADPVLEQCVTGAAAPLGDALIEVHPLPGVMDPDAGAIELAILSMIEVDVRVQTGRRFDFHGVDAEAAARIAERALANPVVHAIHTAPYLPDAFPRGHAGTTEVRTIPLRDLDDEALLRLSREGHLFLSLEEMRALRLEFQALGRDPREIELETIAQTWSEHCVHKTLKARIAYTQIAPDDDPLSASHLAGREGITVDDDGVTMFNNLLRTTVAAATHQLMHDGIDWCLSVFVDNAGVIAFDDDHAVCFKVETHNHPSAIEPYGGAATGIGGCIRDIMGTGLAAKPIAATDIFCVAHPDHWTRSHDAAAAGDRKKLPEGCLHPRRILKEIVSGVRDYGNRMGIPTVNGAVWFHDQYVGNPLVYCGCVGVMPRSAVHGDPAAGDRIIAIGGRTGRDGIHGATFSSAELTDTHADEFSHAVQIGNPVTEKKTLDVILAARDHAGGCLYRAMTDCGAGGFSSAVGEMGEKLGATVCLERAPLKYAGLTPTEIWISEAQERMVLAVPAERVDELAELCAEHDVTWCDLGEFGTPDKDLVLTFHDEEIGRLPMTFLHDGLPERTLTAHWTRPAKSAPAFAPPDTVSTALRTLLAHPNIASKHWIIRQYDHEVQGGSVIPPLVGIEGDGPSDAAVILPVDTSCRGLGLANGLATGFADDPYTMTLLAIDECVRNLVCTGIDPARTAILDNFCWPGCDDAQRLGELVRASVACYDGAMAYRTPFISGKDSLNNQFTTEDGTTIRIPPTLLISGFGIIDDVELCVTMDLKRAGNALLFISAAPRTLQGSHFEMCYGRAPAWPAASMDLIRAPKLALAIHGLMQQSRIAAAHDASDGGLLVAVAEMAIAGRLGVHLQRPKNVDPWAWWFDEGAAGYVVEVAAENVEAVRTAVADVAEVHEVGAVVDGPTLECARDALSLDIDVLRGDWRGTLDW